MAKNITEKVIQFIMFTPQLISVIEDQGFLCHLQFWNPWYAFHYIDSTLELQRVGMRTSFVGLIQQSM